jgi:hypothetical protein
MHLPPNQPPPPPAPKALPHQRFWRWFRTQSVRVQIISCVVLILSCVLCTGISAIAGKGNQTVPVAVATDTPTIVPTAAQTAASTVATPTTPIPTLPPLPAATPTQRGVAATHGTPHLGGPISDFVGAYGQPNDHSDIKSRSYHFLRSTNSNVDGLIVSSVLSYNNRVDDIIVASTGDVQWTPTDAKNRCMTFAPSDAHLKQRLYYADGKGFDIVYSSTQLSHDLSASEFIDTQQNQVQAGLFDVSYLYTSDGQHVDDCELIPGEQQTKD